MNHIDRFDEAFHRCPLIAILRGVAPREVVAIGEALVEAGFTPIEVPQNSPEPFASIALLAKTFAGRAVIGSGTVLRTADVAAVHGAGGAMIISPNTNVGVIAATKRAELVSIPGVATPSEAFAALEAGATALKLFPAEGSARPCSRQCARYYRAIFVCFPWAASRQTTWRLGWAPALLASVSDLHSSRQE
jgi:2-dehydro-3-deoxyphosphogalactonate aldolase